jgi:hypothetical protein
MGDRIGKSLSLVRKGNHDSQDYYFKNPSLLRGTALRDRLLHEVSQVLNSDSLPQGALHIVRRWDPVTASIIGLLLVMISLGASIMWNVVAVNGFGADVQVSTQAGFTIGSNVVTADMQTPYLEPNHTYGSSTALLKTFRDLAHCARRVTGNQLQCD